MPSSEASSGLQSVFTPCYWAARLSTDDYITKGDGRMGQPSLPDHNRQRALLLSYHRPERFSGLYRPICLPEPVLARRARRAPAPVRAQLPLGLPEAHDPAGRVPQLLERDNLLERDQILRHVADKLVRPLQIFGNRERELIIVGVRSSIDGGLGGSGVLDVAREVQLRIKHWGYAWKMTNDTKWAERAWVEVLVRLILLSRRIVS